MPKSKVRKKPVYTPPPAKKSKKRAASAPWIAPAMVACLVLGLAWIALYYVTAGGAFLASLGGWNLLCGFALIVAGIILGTRWR